MQFVVMFEDDPAKAGERAKHMARHLAFLEKHRVQAAGPLIDPANGAGAGGMWLVEAASAADARALVEADPFWPTGLRKSVRILQWKQVFRDGKKLA
ncbi:MAG: YciI family protein [Rhodospirillales bacterium]